MKTHYIIIVIVLLIAAYFLKQYVFNIYEVTFSLSAKALYADGESTIRIEAVPVNAFGFRAPLRKVAVVFDIMEGKDLVEVVSSDLPGGVIVLKSRAGSGKVVLRARSEFQLLPAIIEIPVLSSMA
ncbi:MAG: hypothetical protein ACM3UR_11775 [Bacteroidota bacterium]|jgi:hypothetical protein|nr:hypothetical protein [Ignavibacteria bacterium]MCU7498203.1 hypothetical protein [Ignavibacteria bacterium]MCU7511433.1 hypothetical protein [Ignavibacteria bacterium]MCU7519406.1 hypothetical protein [Ignavibacteria bacterium]MCU7523352.1 hypothetical protein [Ignavibacteria bacterium]